MEFNNSKFFINVVFPLLLGGLIYILFRSENLLMFSWIKFCKIYSIISFFREHNFTKYLPQWFLYSFPDALWVYSFCCFFKIIWIKETKIFFILSGIIIVLSLITELMQHTKIIAGTFDLTDFFFIFLAGIFSLKKGFNNVKNV